MPATPVRQVRVFISSTFRDMNSERDHLVTVVFPELRDRVERLGLEFFDVDLRWGVPHEDLDGERANSWAYCKRWIDEVEPFFVCMLGQRYGWRPPAREILDEADREAYAGLSVTEMEVRHALLNHPHEKHSLFYLRETEVPTDAANYAEFVDEEDLDDLTKLKTLIRESGRPVRPYKPEWTGDGFTDLDNFGQMVLEDLWGAVLRDERYVPRSAWEEVLGPGWEQDPLYADPSVAIPEETWTRLVDAAKPPPRGPLDVEADQMARFAESRLRWFQGRTHELAELHAFVEGDLPEDASRLCVVRAEAGTGKTALLAKLAKELKDSGCRLLTHFVGASEQSASAWALVKRLLDELDRHDIPDPEPEERPELDLNGLSRQLARRLTGYDRAPRLVILLDALNQLTDGHSLFWLPQQLGPNVRIVVSCLDDPQATPDSPPARVLQALQRRRPEPRWVDLAPLRKCDVRQIVREYLHEYCKELDRADLVRLCLMPQARNPLYLRVMLDVLRALGGNDMHLQVSDLIARLPAERPDATSLFTWLLERLAPFGEENVRLWCSYLALGRVGMSGEELAALLARQLGEGDAANEEAARRSARRIERALRRYLQRRGPQWDFFHGALREAVEQHCLRRLAPVALHADIADHLETRWRDGDVHALSELPYHQTEGQQAEELLATLTDYRFLDAKLRGMGVQSLVEDYERAETTPGLGEEEARSLRLIGGALRLSAHVLGADADQLSPQLLGRMLDFDKAPIRALLSQARGPEGTPWLRPLTASLTAPGGPLLRTMRGHSDGVMAVAVTADGRRAVSGSRDNTVRVWDLDTGVEQWALRGHTEMVCAVAVPRLGHRAVSASWDGTLRVWDLDTGAEQHTLSGHAGAVSAVAVTPDGARAISASHDRTLKVWDLESGQEIRTLTGHTKWLRAVAVTPDGARAISASDDLTVRVWDLESGAQLRVLIGGGTVWSVAVTPDGRRALCASHHPDSALREWDLDTGAELRALTGGTSPVWSVAVTPDGRRAVSASEDQTLTVWDLDGSAELRTLSGHGRGVWAVAVTPDGRRAISASDDQTLKAWDLDPAQTPGARPGHSQCVTAVTTTPDGRWVVSAADDKTLKVWELSTGAQLHTLTGHDGPIRALLITADARRAISASADETLRVWDLTAGTELRSLAGHQDRVTTVAVTPDGCRAVSGSRDGTVRVWDLRNGATVATLSGHREAVEALAMAPDGQWAISASACPEGVLKVWDLRTGLEMLTLSGHEEELHVVAATPDGRRAVSGGGAPAESGELRVWDISTGAEVHTLTGHVDEVTTIAVAPDGRWVASTAARYNRTAGLKVWDLDSGMELQDLTAHALPINDVGIAPDGRRIISASGDGTMSVWDVRSGVALCTFSADAALHAVSAAPFGPAVAAGDAAGHVHFLRLENVTPGPAIITAWTAPGDTSPAFGCLRCRVWSEVPVSAVGTERPCPNCGKVVKLNPFVIEADWRPVAAAWRGSDHP